MTNFKMTVRVNSAAVNTGVHVSQSILVSLVCMPSGGIAGSCVDHNKLWEILKEMGIPETWPASWETYMQVRKQQLELDMEQ